MMRPDHIIPARRPLSAAESQMQRAPRGFTLVEMIAVIIITGIIAAVVAVFIGGGALSPVQGYVDSVARAELTDIGDNALRRMARDLRLALPNSVRVSPDGNYLEMWPTIGGGRYLAGEDNVSGNILQFGTGGTGATTCTDPNNPTNCEFDIVGFGASAVVAGSSIVVYNLGPGLSPADAYAGGNIAQVSGAGISFNASGTATTLLTSNPFANQSPQMASPQHRFQVVQTPVTYYCNGAADGSGTLTRYSGYTATAAQPADAAAAPLSTATAALLANDVVSCQFNYAALANLQAALVGLTLKLKKPNSNTGQVTLTHQVHVDNTP